MKVMHAGVSDGMDGMMKLRECGLVIGMIVVFSITNYYVAHDTYMCCMYPPSPNPPTSHMCHSCSHGCV